jgi:chemotaxis protein CheD
MTRAIQPNDSILPPGHVRLPARATLLGCVVASGVAVTIYDSKNHRGGMGHYIKPLREQGASTPVYAAPAIVALVDMFLDSGSDKTDLEAYLFGGAVNPRARNYVEGQSEANVKVGLEILDKLGVTVAGKDVGGTRARKIVFRTGSGENVVAQVDQVRDTDWYPEI